MSVTITMMTDPVRVDQFLGEHHGIRYTYSQADYAPLEPQKHSVREFDGNPYVLTSARSLQTLGGSVRVESLGNIDRRNLLVFYDRPAGGGETVAPQALPAGEWIVGFLRGDYDGNDREDFAFMTSAHHLIVVTR